MWGPPEEIVKIRGLPSFPLPYVPFLKNERIGRVADWTGQAASSDHHHHHHHWQQPLSYGSASLGVQALPSSNNNTHGRRSSVQAPTNPVGEEDEWTMKATAAPAPLRRHGVNQQPAIRPPHHHGQQDKQAFQQRKSGPTTLKQAAAGQHGRFSAAAQRKKDSSAKIQSDWRLLEEIDFQRLGKLQLQPEEDEPTVILSSPASLYDRSNDRLYTAKADKLLPLLECSLPKPKGLQLAAASLAHECGAKVIMTDRAAALLMACQRSIQPWDLLVLRRNDLLFIVDPADVEKVEGQEFNYEDFAGESAFNAANVLVNETAASPPSDDPRDQSQSNSMSSLSAEATRINRALPLLLTKHEKNSVRHTKVQLSKDLAILIQGEYSALVKPLASSSQELFPMNFVTLLEFERDTAGMDWRSKLDAQRGAVLAHEIRNNSAFLARAVFAALLSSVPLLKIAFVSRAAISQKGKSRPQHALLGLHETAPEELAAQMNLDLPHAYGILHAIVDLCLNLPEGTDHMIVRDPNKPALRLYRLPSSTAPLDPIDELLSVAAH